MAKRRHGPAPAVGAPITLRVTCVPPEGQQLTVRFLGNYSGILTHWHLKTSVPCVEECPPVIHRTKTIWKGFAAVEYWRPDPYADWCPTVLEVTEKLDEALAGLELRGQIYLLERKPGEHGKPECFARHIGTSAEALRDAFDFRPVVHRMYRPTSEIVWGVKSPLPPRAVLEAVAGSRPPSVPGVPPPPPPKRTKEEEEQDKAAYRKRMDDWKKQLGRGGSVGDLAGQANGNGNGNGRH